jgi:hypothetical protein
MYKRKTSMNKAAIIKRLAKLGYCDGSCVIEHLNVFQCHINHLSAMKINLEDELKQGRPGKIRGPVPNLKIVPFPLKH